MRTRPTLHEAEDEAETGRYETEAENFGLGATLAETCSVCGLLDILNIEGSRTLS